MAEMVGRGIVITTGTLNMLATATSKTITINNEVIDVTSDGDKGVQRMLDQPGKKSIELSVEGNFSLETAGYESSLFYKALTTGVAPNCGTTIIDRVKFDFYLSGCVSEESEPDFTLTGSFALASFAITAATAEVVTFSATFQSSGVIELIANA